MFRSPPWPPSETDARTGRAYRAWRIETERSEGEPLIPMAAPSPRVEVQFLADRELCLTVSDADSADPDPLVERRLISGALQWVDERWRIVQVQGRRRHEWEVLLGPAR